MIRATRSKPAPKRLAKKPGKKAKPSSKEAVAPSKAKRSLSAPKGFRVETEPLVKGRVYRAETPWGTPVVVRPMPGFSKSYALLATRFGSLDAALPNGAALPLGLAHFLEHKMFETPAGDVFDLYAKRGASANAYTTFGFTAYLFSCTSRFEENLVTLLDTLHTMHAEPAGIEREKGIIGQEIAMYDDDAGWRGYFNLLNALYRDHPIRYDITGSKETIAPIDRDVLLRTHAAYYHPANLSLFVAGDVDPSVVLANATQRLAASSPGAENRRKPSAEPEAPALPEKRQSLSVSRPMVTLGIKDSAPGATGHALVVREAETDLLLDVLYGDGGRVEAPLYREGIVDETFGAGYQADADYGFVSISAEVDEEEPFKSRLMELTEKAAKTAVTEAEVERARRRAIGGYLRTFNSPERVASLLLGLHMKDAGLKEALDALLHVTRKRLDERLAELLSRGRAWSVVVPRAGA